MNIQRSQYRVSRAVTRAILPAAAMLFAGAVFAQSALPPSQRDAQGVSYREGGIGRAESQAMLADSTSYPLMLTFSQREQGKNAYTAGVDVRIKQPKGTTELQAKSDGPLMLVNLPAGHYDVVAKLDGKTEQRAVDIQAHKTQRVYFEWATPA